MALDSSKKKLAETIDGILKDLHYHSPGIDEIFHLITRPPSPEKGNLSLPVFKLTPAGENPTKFAQTVLSRLSKNDEFYRFEATGPYINVFLNPETFVQSVLENASEAPPVPDAHAPLVMVEYASPNTNKPLHIGHLRNICLAEVIIRLLEHEGKRVFRTQILNDRGVHICKSMLAYQKWGKKDTPEKSNMKSDHFVGKYYNLFTKHAEKDPKLEEEAQEMLVKWEKNDPAVKKIWKQMNEWAEKGMFETYARLNATFDKNYYESQFYDKGKEIVQKAFEKKQFKKAENGAIIAPLEKFGLPDKPAMRGDGTSLYITQDIYLAVKRFEEFPELEKIVYIVASEQDMHFQQLFGILQLLGFEKAKKCYHLGYGLVTLPSGKMSTRQGNVINADELISDLVSLSQKELEKRYPELDTTEILRRANVIGLAALRLYLLRVDAKKELVFLPEEAVSFEGQTGPYLLYTNARAGSILRKSTQKPHLENAKLLTLPREKELLTLLSQKNEIIADTLSHYSPHILAQYILCLANTFNTYYHETKIIQENAELEQARLVLVKAIHDVLEECLFLLGIETLKEM